MLALCINKEGFIRYSSILAGNTADPKSLPGMVDTLYAKTRLQNNPKEKVLVCLDAGIATEDNLQKIREKGYKYLCVSRRRLADYEYASDAKTIIREFGIRNAKINIWIIALVASFSLKYLPISEIKLLPLLMGMEVFVFCFQFTTN